MNPIQHEPKPYKVPIIFSLLLLLSASQVVSNGSESDLGQPLNLAVFIEGQVSVKEKGWNSYESVVFGTPLRSGDLLRLGPNSRAKIVCSDLTLHDIEPVVTGIPCMESKSVLLMPNGSLINTTRGLANDGTTPIVLSPRKTKLLSAHPVLRWTAVQGATVYGVTVRGPKLYWEARVDSKTSIVYPESAPPLKPGVNYKLIVETSEKSSVSEPGPELGFSIVDNNEARAVQSAEKQIEGMGLPQGPTQFLIAHLFAAHGLKAEAIEVLEVVANKFKAAAVYRLLGDLYLDCALPRQAESNYLKSVDLAKEEKDEVGQMKVHLALALIYKQVLGNKNAADEHLKLTLALAEKIGDHVTNSQANQLMAEIKQAGK